MRNRDLLLLAGAAVVALWILRGRPATAGTSAVSPGYSRLVKTWNGWQYFSDGTAIGPDGSYYHQGAFVWSPGETLST